MRAILIAVEPLSDSISTYHFRPERPVHYLAGQFTEIQLDCEVDERGNYRQFTISSSPTEPLLSITVNFADSRSAFKAALRVLKPGHEVRLDEPLGDFVLPLDNAAPLIWIAGGIGITPFRSMAAFLADTSEKRNIMLFHSVSNNQDALLFNDALQAAGVQRQVVLSKDNGRLTADAITAHITRVNEPYYYVSGPEMMVSAFVDGLRNLQIRQERIITDAFLGYR